VGDDVHAERAGEVGRSKVVAGEALRLGQKVEDRDVWPSPSLRT